MLHSAILHIFLIFVFESFLLGCGDGATATPAAARQLGAQPTAATKQNYVQTMLDIGVGQYLDTIRPATSSTVGDWEAYFFPTSTGAGCLNETDFITSIRPSTTGSEDVVFFLEGGGGCWNELTCHGVPFAQREANIASSSSGLFDWQDDRNPVKDWNIVYASYCDGSVYSGDNITYYGEHKTYHWGLRNLSAAVTLMKENFPAPGKILVTGSSAGGFGTFMGFGVMRLAYPNEFLYLHNDSGPGFENPKLADSMSVDIRERWRFEQFIPDECEECQLQLTHLIPYALGRDPDMSASLFSYLDDGVIGYTFLQYYSQYPGVLRTTTDEIHEKYPDRFRRFFVDGFDHTILGSDAYYSTWPDGHVFSNWLGGFLESDLDRWVDIR